MARTRALMTKTDRKQIADQEAVDENKRYQAISRVRSRIQEELTKDVEVLREHHPELYEELKDVVCDTQTG
jgi:NTP pyrophosphatase (non-canonical NTP hydrolase)